MKNKQPIRVGDIFKTTLADGRFGAIRILKSWETSFLVATTPYISTEPPNISDPLLKSVLIKKRFSWKNKPAWCVYAGKIPKPLELLGNIGLTPEEEQIRPHGGSAGFPSAGGWPTDVGHDVYDEWRWDHDREAYEAEVKRESEERQKARQVQPKPKKMMEDDDFWKLISLLD